MRYISYFFGGVFVLCGIIWGCSECKAKSINSKKQSIIEILADTETVVRSRTIAYVDPTQDDDKVAEIYQQADRYEINRNQVLGIVSKNVSDITERLSKEGFKTVERSKSNLNKIMDEHEFQMSEWSSSKKVAEVGKGQNADLVLTFIPRIRLATDGEAYVTLDSQFLDINTMQVYNFKYDGTSFSNWDFNLLKENTDTILGSWFCDGVMRSSVKYSKSNALYITSFAGANPLVAVDEKTEKKYMKNRIQQMIIGEDDGVVIFDNTQEKDRIIKFTPEKDKTISLNNITYEDVLDKNVSVYDESGSGVSTLKIGSVTIRDENGSQILKGPVYRRGDNIGIFVGTSGKNNTGYAYFVMFSK